jgi:hypothetical protein
MISWRAFRPRVLLAAMLVVACSGDSTAPVAGTLKVSLTTPNSGLDGAAIIVISGPAVPTSVSAAAGLTLWGAPLTTPTGKVILTGTLATGPVLTLQVEDINKVSQYHATLQQVADSTPPYELRTPLTGYSLTITK